MTHLGAVIIFVGFAIAAGAIALLTYAGLTRWLSSLNARALTQRGVPTDAVITALERRRGPRGAPLCGMKYRYQARTTRGIATLEGRESIREDEYHRYAVGGVIFVHYLPDRPEIVRRTEVLARLPGRKVG